MTDSNRTDPPDSSVRDELEQAYDFDRADPMVGLNHHDLSGTKISRRATLRLLAAAGTLTAMHLIPGTGAIAPARAAKSGGTLRCGWAGVGEILTLDPAQINQVLQFQIMSNVISGLTHINADLIAEPDLAESWEVSADGRQYTFSLRKGVTFHNGDAFDADDVLFTFNRSKDPQKSIHARVLKNVEDLSKVDSHTVRFTLAKPQASFLVKTTERASGRALSIVSRGALASMGDTNYGLMPVGTGPFKVTKHVLGQGVELEKNPNYYDPERPKLDKIIIKPIDGAEPIAGAMEAGDIQFIGGNPIPAQLADRFEANPDLIVNEKPGPGFQSVWINPWHDAMKVTDFNKPMAELKKDKGFMVRLAIGKALDRERFVKQARFGRGVPAYGSINPAMGFYYDAGISETSEQRFDLEAARALMASAGYPNGEGFPALELICTPGTKRDAQVVANILKKNIGITVKVMPKEFSVGIADFNTMNFDMRLGGSGGDYDPDDGLVDWMQTASKFNGQKRDKATKPFGFYSESESDALIAKQSATADPEARRALVHKANKINSDKVTCAFLYHPVDIQVRHKSVNFPDQSRIPGLADLDRVTLS
jgi:peptide/nickel transport system substrate-binding protein